MIKKFRAWDRKNKKWLWPYPEAFNIIGEVTVFDILHQIQMDQVRDLVIFQYTGFQDKNGKDIFEGDFLKYKNPNNDTPSFEAVQWANDLGCWHFGNRDDANTCMLCDVGVKGAIECEIVGNVFENEEFLK
jgi:uncharacterized phage protein (TIGR01671 family)